MTKPKSKPKQRKQRHLRRHDVDPITLTPSGSVIWKRFDGGRIIVAGPHEGDPRAALARQLREARKERKRHDDAETRKSMFAVISPDGIPISPERFPSREAAQDALAEWCKRYEMQGYYAAVDRRIQLDVLLECCAIEEIEE